VLLRNGHVLVADALDFRRVFQHQVLGAIVRLAHLVLLADLVQNSEAESDSGLCGRGLLGLDLTGEEVEAEDEGVGQPLAVLARPEADAQVPAGLDAVDVDVEGLAVQAVAVGAVAGRTGADRIGRSEHGRIGGVGSAATGFDLVQETLDGPSVFELDVSRHRGYHLQVGTG